MVRRRLLCPEEGARRIRGSLRRGSAPLRSAGARGRGMSQSPPGPRPTPAPARWLPGAARHCAHMDASRGSAPLPRPGSGRAALHFCLHSSSSSFPPLPTPLAEKGGRGRQSGHEKKHQAGEQSKKRQRNKIKLEKKKKKKKKEALRPRVRAHIAAARRPGLTTPWLVQLLQPRSPPLPRPRLSPTAAARIVRPGPAGAAGTQHRGGPGPGCRGGDGGRRSDARRGGGGGGGGGEGGRCGGCGCRCCCSVRGSGLFTVPPDGGAAWRSRAAPAARPHPPAQLGCNGGRGGEEGRERPGKPPPPDSHAARGRCQSGGELLRSPAAVGAGRELGYGLGEDCSCSPLALLYAILRDRGSDEKKSRRQREATAAPRWLCPFARAALGSLPGPPPSGNGHPWARSPGRPRPAPLRSRRRCAQPTRDTSAAAELSCPPGVPTAFPYSLDRDRAALLGVLLPRLGSMKDGCSGGHR